MVEIKIKIEEDPTPLIPSQRFWVLNDSDVLVKDDGEFHTLMPSCGEGADIALRAFISSISGRSFKKGASTPTYQFCPKIEWDGILRLPVKTRKKRK